MATVGKKTYTNQHSFILDGAGEYFTIPQSAFAQYCQGNQKQFTLFFSVLRTNTGTDEFFGCWGSGGNSTLVRFTSSDQVNFLIRDGAASKNLQTPASYNSTTTWYHIAIMYDGVTPASSEVYINDNEDTSVNTLTSDIDSATGTYDYGQRDTGTDFRGYIGPMAMVNRIVTSAEQTRWYNNGKPLNPQKLFKSNCKYFFDPNNSNDTAQFEVTDPVNKVTATSVAMEDADKVQITPYR